MVQRASMFRMTCLLAGLAQVACQSSQVTNQEEPAWTTLAPGLSVNHDQQQVRIRCWSCLDQGYLEQVLCMPGTREHESLLVTDVPASSIHAALLLVGIEPGSPGRWHEVDGRVELLPPVGDAVQVAVLYEHSEGCGQVHEPVSRWIAELQTGGAFPTDTWIFGGSLLLDEEDLVGEGSRYLADHSGSVIGLVTFGDEMLGLPMVIPDAASIQEPEWVVRMEHVPPPGTKVQVLLSPGGGSQPASGMDETEGETEG